MEATKAGGEEVASAPGSATKLWGEVENEVRCAGDWTIPSHRLLQCEPSLRRNFMVAALIGMTNLDASERAALAGAQSIVDANSSGRWGRR